MASRGLRKLLKSTQPARLVGSGARAGYALVKNGAPATRVRGVARRLQLLHSSGVLPMMARRAEPRPGGHWRGPAGGRARGRKVDAQISRLVNAGPAALDQAPHVYRLTRCIVNALDKKGLKAVRAQRCVASEEHRLGTAADIVCFDEHARRLVFVELKCGHDHGRLSAACDAEGSACTMRGPLHRVSDCTLHRHFAQLSATMALFAREGATHASLKALGIDSVDGMVVYAGDKRVDFYALPSWWKKKGAAILDALK
jgi:hypothetical protein